jgi:hypothetical protein
MKTPITYYGGKQTMAKQGGSMKKRKAKQATLAVTNVMVYPVNDKTKTKAIARVAINGQLQLTGLKVYDGASGIRGNRLKYQNGRDN